MPPSPTPPRRLPPRPWAPTTDAEWAALAPLLPGGAPDPAKPRRGRPPSNLRRTVDALFWVAASQGPWAALPPDLGRPGSVQRTLHRWARSGLLVRLLGASTGPQAGALQGLAWFLARTFRRVARLMPNAALVLVRDVLRLADAWPANPLRLRDRNLSESAKRTLDAQAKGLRLYARRLARQAETAPPDLRLAGIDAARALVRAMRAGLAQLRLAQLGNRNEWRAA